MFHIEYRYQEIRDRQSRYRAEAAREREGQAPRHRTFRRRIGESIIQIGRRVAGDAMRDSLSDVTTPA